MANDEKALVTVDLMSDDQGASVEVSDIQLTEEVATRKNVSEVGEIKKPVKRRRSFRKSLLRLFCCGKAKE